jgi:hypothetical protein
VGAAVVRAAVVGSSSAVVGVGSAVSAGVSSPPVPSGGAVVGEGVGAVVVGAVVVGPADSVGSAGAVVAGVCTVDSVAGTVPTAGSGGRTLR